MIVRALCIISTLIERLNGFSKPTSKYNVSNVHCNDDRYIKYRQDRSDTSPSPIPSLEYLRFPPVSDAVLCKSVANIIHHGDLCSPSQSSSIKHDLATSKVQQFHLPLSPSIFQSNTLHRLELFGDHPTVFDKAYKIQDEARPRFPATQRDGIGRKYHTPLFEASLALLSHSMDLPHQMN
jgi:hypothetical protein